MPAPIPNTRYTIASGIGMFPEGGTVCLHKLSLTELVIDTLGSMIKGTTQC